MKWLEIEVIVRDDDADVVSLLLYELTGYGLVCEPGDPDGATCPASVFTAGTRMKAYLPGTAVGKIDNVRKALSPFLVEPIMVRELPETDWLRAYREHYKTFRVGKWLVVRPPWEEYHAMPGDLVVTIDPGLAFGCGTHPTTQLCLELLKEVVRPGAVIYDVGTGSGILAIASALLGAEKVVAVDVDEVTVRVARENVALNGLEATVYVVEGNLLEGLTELAHVIAANLTAEVVIGFAGQASRRLRPGGAFIAGGIPEAGERQVLNELQKCFTVLKVTHSQGWVGILATL